ncbi:MAG: transglutaminaseTgpA domain-containing protein [Aggregatilineales bacterium]
MATTTQSQSSSLERAKRRLINAWRSFFLPGDFVTLFIVLALQLMPALALQASGWPIEMGTLVPVAVISVIFGFVLARSQYVEILGFMLSMVYGACIVLLISAYNQPGSLADGMVAVFSRFVQWLLDAFGSGINTDDLVLTLLASALFWFLGYNLTWHVFRIDRVWRAVLPSLVILISNAVYYTGSANLEIYLLVFVFLTLLLVVRSHLEAREWDWYSNGVRVPRNLRQQVFRAGVLLALLLLIGAWMIPSSDIQERLNRFQEFLQTEPFDQLAEVWNRLFTSIETTGPTTSDYYGSDSLELGGAIRLGDQIVLVAAAPNNRRYYWRSRVFDFYDMGRWTSAADTRLTDPEAPLEIIEEPGSLRERVLVQQRFTIGVNASRLVYAAPQAARIDLPTRSDLRYTPEGAMVISVVRPLRVLYQGASYSATSLMSNATSEQLRAAGTNYPQWIVDTYSSYIPSMTGRTVQLAAQIVADAGAVTPYDKARAIESWLRANITYNESIPQPPPGQDPVDWVLFDYREGYCNYYASAMVVMLRSLNIPARMAAGFAQGEWVPAEQAFIVRERDAHTWVEVYFPGYGWIEFEPTSAQAPISRGDQLILPQVPTPTVPTPTPTPTPTVEPTPTPTPPEEAPPDELEAEGQMLPPTVTPTFTPSPTPTPVIVPTEPPPVRPQPRDPFSFLMPALGLGLLILMIVLLIVVMGTFIYWYWEWRGMRGLSPISRAYARLQRYIALIGIHPRPEQTPEERRSVIVNTLPAAEPPVTAITRMYTAERYGPAEAKTPSTASKTADRAWLAARRRVLGRFWRRILMPWKRE